MAEATEPPSLWRKLRMPVLLGSVFMLLFFGGFGAWSALAPLAGGASAPGVISPEGARRTVQHLEGGIIAAILVRDGDRVEAGEPLMILEDVPARARVDILMHQRWAHLAFLARLNAEDLGHAAVEFPEELEALRHTDEDVRTLLLSQEQMFDTRRHKFEAERQMLLERIDQLSEEIRGLQAQVESAARQLELIDAEIADKTILVKKNLMPKPELLALQRAEAQILGARGEYEAEIARAKQQVSETEQQLLSLEAERDAENAEARDEKLAALNEISKDLAAGHDILKRTTINSPVAGTVLELRFRTIGGVVQPGDAILDIVPENEDLLIEARISPADVDVVHAGLPAKVQLTAFASRATPKVDGLVRSVSADRITDDRWPEPFFLARVQVDRDALKRAIGAEAQLVPGMPADVLVVTGERTLLGYLLQPLRDNLGRALREG